MTKIKSKHLQEFKDKELPIVEIFGNTLQGEGPRLRPAIFIRTGLCNFTCSGFGCERAAPDGTLVIGCDTIQAVSKKFKNTWDYYSDFNQIVERVKPFIHPNPDVPKADIIITGGEPLLHWENKTFQQMLEYYVTRGHKVTIESNGSKIPVFDRPYQHKLMFSLSVKLSNSGEPKKKRINIPAIQQIMDNTEGSYLKFVVNPQEWDEIQKEIFEILTALPTWVDVFLMPQGATTEDQLKNMPFVFEKCAELGFAFSPRIHILCFSDKDGI